MIESGSDSVWIKWYFCGMGCACIVVKIIGNELVTVIIVNLFLKLNIGVDFNELLAKHWLKLQLKLQSNYNLVPELRIV